MAERPAIYTPPPILKRVLGPFAWRPRLTTGIAAGCLLFGALSLIEPDLAMSTRAILSWDLTCFWYIALVLTELARYGAPDIKARAAAEDEARHFILAVVLVAATASLAAVGIEMSAAKDTHGLARLFHVVLVVGTVALSWFMVQLVFALHYAHEYYAPDDGTPENDVMAGLKFLDDQEPDYWDFVHFAVVIGAASQTADIAFTSKPMRRIGTVHSIVSFVFNTVVLALTINLAAGLF